MSEELKMCKCGGIPRHNAGVVDWESGKWADWIVCYNCMQRSRYCASKDEAVTEWNKLDNAVSLGVIRLTNKLAVQKCPHCRNELEIHLT